MEHRFQTHRLERNREFRDLIPSLLRFAADPRIDAMGRISIFDALRQVTGSNLADDIATWATWYASTYGATLPTYRIPANIEDFIAACPWLLHEAQ